MPVQVVVPPAGDAVVEGRLGAWKVKNGQAVQIDQELFDVETDKLTTTAYASTAGVIHILVTEGEVVQIGQVVATIDETAVPAAAESAGTESAGAAPATPAAAVHPHPVAAASTVANSKTWASPAARAMILDRSLDPAQIPATGPGSRITKADVLDYLAGPGPAGLTKPSAPAALPSVPAISSPRPPVSPSAQPGRETRTAMTPLRKTIARRLLESQTTTATLTTFNEADMSAAQELRAKYNEKFEKKHGVKLGFSSLFVKAAIEALKAFPIVNARIEGTDIVQQHFYDIGVAVSTDTGLVVPVLRDADKLSFAGIEKAVSELAKKARDRKLGMDDLQGGTFTITNGGIFGSLMSTPILNPPQTAILGMHAIQKRPVVVNDQIVIRPMMYLALSYDHRLLDGREAVQFLVRIKECVENPERMLIDI